MVNITHNFNTRSRIDLIALSRAVVLGLGPSFFVPERGGSIIEILGHYASGKSLIADAMRAELFGEDVENPKWKHLGVYKGHINGKPATITFVNARHDFLNATALTGIRLAQASGPLFILNRPAFEIGKIFSSMAVPKALLRITVLFPLGEERPRQFGPFKFGEQKPVGNRLVILERT
jgi:hypothetical protein